MHVKPGRLRKGGCRTGLDAWHPAAAQTACPCPLTHGQMRPGVEIALRGAALPDRRAPCKRSRHRQRAALRRPFAAGPVAQWLEPAAHNGLVAGSSPAGPTSLRWLRQLRLGKPFRSEGCRAEAHLSEGGPGPRATARQATLPSRPPKQNIENNPMHSNRELVAWMLFRRNISTRRARQRHSSIIPIFRTPRPCPTTGA